MSISLAKHPFDAISLHRLGHVFLGNRNPDHERDGSLMLFWKVNKTEGKTRYRGSFDKQLINQFFSFQPFFFPVTKFHDDKNRDNC